MKKILKGTAVLTIAAVAISLSSSIALARGQQGNHNNGGMNIIIVANENNATVVNDVKSEAYTGSNTANNNGSNVEVDIETGNADSKVEVDNEVNTNKTYIDPCPCQQEEEQQAGDCGCGGRGGRTEGRSSIVVAANRNNATLVNSAGSIADTGMNTANDNGKTEPKQGRHGCCGCDEQEQGEVTIDISTGDASSSASVWNRVNTNITRIQRSGSILD